MEEITPNEMYCFKQSYLASIEAGIDYEFMISFLDEFNSGKGVAEVIAYARYEWDF